MHMVSPRLMSLLVTDVTYLTDETDVPHLAAVPHVTDVTTCDHM